MFKALRFGVIATIFSLFISTPAFASDNGVAYVLHTVRAETGKSCMVGHYHYGKGPALASKAKALKAAIRHYSSFTALEYGSSWGSFSRGASRSVNCEKVSISQWKCKVAARPCRKGQRLAGR